MRSISRWLALAIVLTVVTAYAGAAGLQAPSAPAAQEGKSFQGTLVKVDANTNTLTAQGADKKEMQFNYTEKTEVVGPDKTVQGLAGKSGAKLRITYMVDKGANHATRIEVLPD